MAEDQAPLNRLYEKLVLLGKHNGGAILSAEEVKLLAGDIKSQDPSEQFQFQQHEVLHTVSVLMDVWDTHVVKSRFVAENQNLQEQAIAAGERLGDFFQLIGNTDFKPGGDEK